MVTPMKTIILIDRQIMTLVLNPKLYGILLIKLANKIKVNIVTVAGIYSENPIPN
jgi:hypothetical protein